MEIFLKLLSNRSRIALFCIGFPLLFSTGKAQFEAVTDGTPILVDN